MQELCIECNQDQVELLSEALLQAGALAVALEDAHADTEDELPIFGEPGQAPQAYAWQYNRLAVLLPLGISGLELLHSAAPYMALSPENLESLPWQIREVPDEDWVKLTQAQFQPILIEMHLWIVPTWHVETMRAQIKPQQQMLQLDPGLAFGTGSHPTTHLCLAWLVHYFTHKDLGTLDPALPVSNAKVLDYGCGSGILAIAAAKLGAAGVCGVDIDAQAVISAQDNARLNQVTAEFMLPDDFVGHSLVDPLGWDVVVANILSSPLKVLAPMLLSQVKPGGRLILSGVLARQAHEVAAAYAPLISLSVWRELDGWVCLHGVRC